MDTGVERLSPLELKRFRHRLKKQATVVLSLVVFILLVGIAGYIYIEKMNLLEAFYMTVITLSTVGFQEVKPLSAEGRLFTSTLIILGVGTFAYSVGIFSKLLVEGEVKKLFELKKREERMKNLRNHVIVCGFGKVGQKVCEEFEKEGIPFVVIDSDPERIREAENRGYLFLFHDSTEEEGLLKAGVKYAKALVTVMGSDTSNLFVVLTARELNPNLRIISRVDDPANEKKLYKAGADKVIAPYNIGAVRLAQAAIRPVVVDFVEFATSREGPKFFLDQIEIREGSPAAGKSIVELDLRRKTGAIIVAIVREGNIIENPDPVEVLREGDLLIALGRKEQIDRLYNLIAPSEKL